VVEQLLPIVPMKLENGQSAVEFAYEPDKETILDQILPMYVQVEIYRAALESTASEYGARMTAMENATNNASDMIKSLTLEYNKARQAAITKELLEIVGWRRGAQGIGGTQRCQLLKGKISQVQGAVVDVVFEGDLPRIYTALTVSNPRSATKRTTSCSRLPSTSASTSFARSPWTVPRVWCAVCRSKTPAT
jgi:hypothetical protein